MNENIADLEPDLPLVSIGIPTYNRIASLRLAIESALAQEYSNLEVLVSDNASADDTEQVCRVYAKQDSRIRYFRQEVNFGATRNFQFVLQRARGEYFIWLADDDWLDPMYARRCLTVLRDNPDCTIAAGMAKYYRNGTLVFTEPPVELLSDSRSRRVASYFGAVEYNGVFYGLMRRTVLQNVPFLDSFSGDWLLVGGVVFHGKVRAVQGVAVHRSLEGASEDVRELVQRYGWPALFARNPHLATIATVFTEIAWRSPAYTSARRRERWVLAVRAAFAILMRHCTPVWIGRMWLAFGSTGLLRRTLRSLRDHGVARVHDSPEPRRDA